VLIIRVAIAVALVSLLSAPATASPIYSFRELSPLTGDFYAEALSINALGQVVGYSRSVDGRDSAALWDNGTVDNLSPQATPSNAYVAYDINDVEQIVGGAFGCEIGICPEFHEGDIPAAVGPIEGFGPMAWLAPGASASGLPVLSQCLLDDIDTRISNSGRTASLNGLSGVAPGDDACGVHVDELLENGIALTPLGYLYEVPAGAL
jgi:probable HAF family extracellular repeat protein